MIRKNIFIYFKELDYVLLRDYEDLYFSYDAIKRVLQRAYKKEVKKVLVDLYFRNGNTFNRFMELDFSDPLNVKSTIVVSKNVSEDIKQNTIDYLNKEKEK